MRIAWIVVVTLALVGGAAVAQGPPDIYVDASAPSGGTGTTPATAYRTIAQAIVDATGKPGTTIRVAPGTYVEQPNTTITAAMRIVGSTVLELDCLGLPTGAVSRAAIVKASALLPPNGAILRVHASHVGITGLVFDGAGTSTLLLRVDGATHPDRALDGISIERNAFLHAAVSGLNVRLASATIAGNYLARNGLAGSTCSGGYERTAEHPAPGRHVLFRGNRVADNRNVGAAFTGQIGSRQTENPIPAGPSVLHVEIVGNEFARNGINQVYPAPAQNVGLLFNINHRTENHTDQQTRVDATIHHNRFVDNVWYGLGVSQRAEWNDPQAPCIFDGRLRSNVYCGNGLNAAIFDFSLIAQTHRGQAGGVSFRFGHRSVFTIDARGDPLSGIAFDYDHPKVDAHIPSPADTENRLCFNGRTIPPGAERTRITLPPNNAPPVVDAPPSIALLGANPLAVARNAPFVDPGVTASDPCEGYLTARITVSGSVDTTTPGTYTLTYTVTDAGGKSASASRTVTVN